MGAGVDGRGVQLADDVTVPPRVYLAGPDVFHPDHARIFAERAAICRRYGLEPLIPMDNAATTAPEIYESNVRLLQQCDAVIANVTPFRGPNCDVGTAWEMGYVAARGMPVFAFSEARGALLDRIPDAKPAKLDAAGMAVEDFGLGENLMIALSVVDRTIHATFEAAAAAAARHPH